MTEALWGPVMALKGFDKLLDRIAAERKIQTVGDRVLDALDEVLTEDESVSHKFKVAVYGDGMVDIYHLAETNRISPEAPIPVFNVKDTLQFAGGAGNVSRNLSALGVEVHYRYNTGPRKNRLMVGDTQVARWDENDRCEPLDKARQKFYEKENQLNAIVVADYNKGSITPEIVEHIKSFGVPIFVDTKRDPSVWSGLATAVFPNIKEFYQFPDEYDNFDGLIVLKRGEDGLSITDEGIDSPSQARVIRSVNGAGDTVLAAFVYRYLLNANQLDNFNEVVWQDILDFANAAAAVAVESPYTSAPTFQQVQERLHDTFRISQ